MRKCRKCKDVKDENEFPEWGGKPGHVCGDCKGAKSAPPKAKAKKQKQAKVPDPEPELSLAFPAGFGFDANTRGDVIQIDQWGAEGGVATSIVLSRAEFATILAHFGEWSGEAAA